jgi:hypothetical protein
MYCFWFDGAPCYLGTLCDCWYSPAAPGGVGPRQVKTQRALNDYRKSAYPHYKDELTRLRFIGAITATRLKVHWPRHSLVSHQPNWRCLCVGEGWSARLIMVA